MKTQRDKIRIAAVISVLATLSGLALMAFAGDRALYGGSLDSLGAGVPGAILAPSAPTAAAYIKFDGVDGEAQDRDHRSWSELISFSQSQLVPTDAFTSRATGRVVFEDIVITKELDKASPKLAEAVAKGKVFPTVVIHWARVVADGTAQTYYTYELKNVQVTSYSIGGSTQSDPVPTETLSLNFEEIKVTYTESSETGQAKGNVEYSWKVEEGAK
jgi:type VI secretion system secreted protein Hcp